MDWVCPSRDPNETHCFKRKSDLGWSDERIELICHLNERA